MLVGQTMAGVFSSAVDDILRLLIVTILASLFVAFLAAVAALLLRLRHTVNARRLDALKGVWNKRILSLVVMSESEPDHVVSYEELDAEIARMTPRAQRALLEIIVRYAFVVTGSARDRLCRLATPALPSVMGLLDRRDPALRALGIHVLGQLGLEQHEDLVLGALNDTAPVVCKTAARALARAGHVDYVEPILATAARLTHWGVSEVVSVLQEIGPQALPHLRSAFSDSNRPVAVRAICAETLRWLNDLESADTAVELLRVESDRELLAASLRLLRRVGGAEHAPDIRRLCTSHDDVVRLNAVAALSATSTGDDGDADRLGIALADPSTWVAIRAARGLRELNEPEHLLSAISVDHRRANLARDVWPELDDRILREAA